MSAGELGCTYAALLLYDDGIPITLFEKRDIEDLILTVGAGGGPAVAVAAAPVTGGAAAAAAPAAVEKKLDPKDTATMMMSIFSSFDALSAELFGQKLSLSNSRALSSTETKQQQGVGILASDHKNAGSPPSTYSTGGLKKAGEASPPSSSRQQQQRRQRFALEFDGVHCFETIIPY
ncbi:hypothetical protein HAX54_046038 [Datura stramonium]|uniref:Uncharacterized protein n=1 Tax=Datura stramonium TaxID=4076 RepID=A0ABS8SR62_DATST|nr:hypothetical protein [Datura stramonium]